MSSSICISARIIIITMVISIARQKREVKQRYWGDVGGEWSEKGGNATP